MSASEELAGVVALIRDLGVGPVPERVPPADEHEDWARQQQAAVDAARTREALGLPCQCFNCDESDTPNFTALAGEIEVRGHGDVTVMTIPRPCRLCGDAAYSRDPSGPVHPCCLTWAAQIAQTGRCPACAIAKAARRAWAAKQQQQVRAPRLSPARAARRVP